jgi:hypothetical protein
MLNRTNRTLTANLNRLNLGTRSLAFMANGFNGTVTLRLRQTQGDSPRDGISGIPHSRSIRHSTWAWRSLIPCSSPEGPWCLSHRVAEPVAAVPEVPSPVVRPVVRSRRDRALPAQSQPHTATKPGVRFKSSGPATQRRVYPNLKRGLDLGRTRVRAARPAAATVAAAGG